MVFAKESNTSLWPEKKNKLLDRPKQTEIAKHIHRKFKGAETMQTNMICVTFDMTFATPKSNDCALLKTLP